MKKLLVMFLGLLLVATLSALAHAATGDDPTYGFSFFGPQISMSPSGGGGTFAGDNIEVTGSGSFDPAAGTVVASGSFTISTPSGSEVRKGIWKASSLDSFQAFGGPRPGFQGGQLKIIVTVFPDGGSPRPNVPVTVNCLIFAPPGFSGSEGITFGEFTQVVRGATLFHLND